jgi:hypothetical protein
MLAFPQRAAHDDADVGIRNVEALILLEVRQMAGVLRNHDGEVARAVTRI